MTAAPAPQPRKPSTAFGPADTERGNVYGRNVEIGAPVMDLYSQYGIRAVEREAGRLAAEAEEAMSGMGEELEEATVSDMIVDSQPKPSRTFESDPIREIIGLTFFMGTMAVLAYVATKA